MTFDILLFIDDGCNDDILSFAERYLPDQIAASLTSTGHFGMCWHCIPDSYAGRLKDQTHTIVRGATDDIVFWKKLFASTSADHVVKIFADAPFLDPAVIVDMKKLHDDYLAEYTFSENLPAGFSCEIIARELVNSLGESPGTDQSLGQLVKTNINQFDVEIYYQGPDIRDKRVSFRTKSPRDRRIMEAMLSVTGTVPAYAQVRGIFDENPDLLSIAPSYIELEITGNCDIDCLFCYRRTLKQNRGDMDVALIEKVLTDMNEFGLPYSLCLGGSGEPMQHPRFYQILDQLCSAPLVDTIVVETNGINAGASYRSFLAEHTGRIKTIINVNGDDRQSYQVLHGADCFDQVYENCKALAEWSAGDHSIYLQVMKINETRYLPGTPAEGREYLDRYYDFWEPLGIPIILQKQNTFLGRIADRRYSDLSPLERIPCWHLARDLYIHAGGTIAFCKQDCDGENAAGSLVTDTIGQIWSRKRQAYRNDYLRQYPVSPDCKQCDEWYTFNL